MGKAKEWLQTCQEADASVYYPHSVMAVAVSAVLALFGLSHLLIYHIFCAPLQGFTLFW